MRKLFFFFPLLFSSLATTTPNKGMEDCPFVSITATGVNFTHGMDHKADFGFTIECTFSAAIENVQATSITYGKRPVDITQISSTSWIFSVTKIGKSAVRVASLSVTFTPQSDQPVLLTSANFNGQPICREAGVGVTTVVYNDQRDQIYDSHRECVLKEVLYEEETQLTLEQDFFSDRIGLAIDILFGSDVDKMLQVSNMFPRRRNGRHYSLVNSGIITSKDHPVKVTFMIEHKGRPPPRVAAVVMNDFVVCGFSPSLQVVQSPDLSPLVSSVEDGNDDVIQAQHLMFVCAIMNACALLVSIATGAFAWKVTSPPRHYREDAEPIYSMPKKE